MRQPIRVVMFDLGGTLVDAERRPFPHVREALAAIAAMKTGRGRPVECCLVSDFDIPRASAKAADERAIFKKYVAILESAELAELFRPFTRRVTLSMHVAAMKPDSVVFETAIRRLGIRASLRSALLITKNAKHIAAARKLGLASLQFASGSSRGDFDDWSRAPLLVAGLLDGPRAANASRALAVALAPSGVRIRSARAGRSDRLRVELQLGSGAVPARSARRSAGREVDVDVTLDARGLPTAVAAVAGSDETSAEVAAYVGTLLAHGRVATARRAAAPGAASSRRAVLPPGATHELQQGPDGAPVLTRRRFSAI